MHTFDTLMLIEILIFSFEFKFNIVRDDEISYWYSKIKKLNVKTDVLH